MITQPLTAVKRGNTLSDATMDWSSRGCRPQAQYEAVLAHFRRHPAAWVCGDPFTPEHPGQSFKCAFLLSYFDVEGRSRTVWVNRNGSIDYSGERLGSPIMAAEALLVAKQYGLFRGGE